MKMQIMAIRDRALNAYMTPWYAQSINQAIRMFQDELTREGSEMRKHPDDYDLYHLGEYDDQTGKHQSDHDAPQQVAIGKHLKTTA